jgi:hypothetical protein
VDACLAINVTNPDATSVITPLLSIVATLTSLDEYVIAPLLILVGNVDMENGAEPYVRVELTVNVLSTGVALLTVSMTVLDASVKFVVAD